MMKKRAVCLPAMFEQGCAFLDCAEEYHKLCAEKPIAFSAPYIVSYVFACEVFLKELLNYYRASTDSLKGKELHNLKALYDLLPDDVRKKIMLETIVKSGCEDLEFRICRNLNCGDRRLWQISDAFMTWRYSYELPLPHTLHVDILFMQVFCSLLRELCCKNDFKMAWKDYKKVLQ